MENAVGFIRRNLFVPVPQVGSLAELNEYFKDGCEKFAEHNHYRKHEPISQLFHADQQALKPCPSVPFEPVRFEVRRTDKTGVVTVENNRYLVGPSWAKRTVTVKLSHDTVTILDDHAHTIIALPRVFGTATDTIINPVTLLPALARKPGGWPQSLLRGHMPDTVVTYLDQATGPARREFFTQAATTAASCGFAPTTQAAQQLIDAGASPHGPNLDITARCPTLRPDTASQHADLAIYDTLLPPHQSPKNPEPATGNLKVAL